MRNFLLIIFTGLFVFSCKSKITPEQIEARRIEDKQIIEEYKKECERVEKLSKKEDKNARFKKGVPETLDEAVRFLEKKLNKKDVERFKKSDDNDLVSLHMGFGMSLRNGWGLWGGRSKLSYFFLSRGITHPDNMSSVIMSSFSKYLQGRDYRLEEEKKYPELMKAFDAVIEDNPEKLRQLVKKDKKLLKDKNSKGISVLRLAVSVCSGKVVNYLTSSYKKISDSDLFKEKHMREFITHCDSDGVLPIVERLIKEKEMKDGIWRLISEKEGVVSRVCKSLNKLDKELIRTMLVNSFSSGNWEDVQCLYEKVPKPFSIPFWEMTKTENEKVAEFMLKLLEPSKDEKSIKSFTENKAIYLPAKVFEGYIKKFNIKKHHLEGSKVVNLAVRLNSPEKLKILKNIGMSLETKDGKNNPLHEAVSRCKYKSIDLLLENDVDMNKLDDAENSILMALFGGYCSNNFNKEILAKYIVAKGKNLDSEPSYEEESPPFLLVKNIKGLSLDFIKFLKKRGMELFYNDDNLLLFSSLENPDINVLKFIVSEGYDVNSINMVFSTTPLIRSVQISDVDKIKFLLKLGADPNQSTKSPFFVYGDEHGMYPIHATLSLGSFNPPTVEIINLLIKKGADPKVKNAAGLSTYELAKKILKLRSDFDQKLYEIRSKRLKEKSLGNKDKKFINHHKQESSETKKLKEIVELLKKYE